MVLATEWLSSPLSRDAEHSGKQSLGLVLYIASVIARAYGGALTVASTPPKTVFVFKMEWGEGTKRFRLRISARSSLRA